MKKVLKVLLIILIVIVLIIGLALLGSRGVKSAADDVFAKLQNGQVEQVYNQSVFPDQLSLNNFKKAMGIGGKYDITKAKKIRWLGQGFNTQNGVKEVYIYGEFQFSGAEKPQVLTFWFVKDGSGNLRLSGITPGEPETQK